MGAVTTVAGGRRRRNRRSSALVAGLLAVTVAVVLAALAGARRTEDALESFVAADKGADGYAAFTPEAFGGTATPDLAAEQAQVDAVEGVAGTARFSDAIVSLSGPGTPGGNLVVRGYVGIDPDGIEMLARLHLVRGRYPDQRRADEVLVDEELARDVGLDVGSTVPIGAYRREQLLAGLEQGPAGLEVDAEVVGVVRRPTDLRDARTRRTRPNDYTSHHNLYLTIGFWSEADGDVAGFNPIVAVDVSADADVDDVLDSILRETGAYTLAPQRFLEVEGTYTGVARSVSLHARGLQVFAVVLALAGLFLVGQTLGRQLALEAVDDDTLLTLGMTPLQLRLVALVRAAPVAVAGALLGGLGAVALSPLAPLPGTVARRAELDLGVDVDPYVLVLGAVVAAALALLAAALPAIRATGGRGRGQATSRRPTFASRLASRGVSAPAVVGVRFALEPGRGRSAVPVRTAIATAAVAVAVVVAAGVFSTSLTESREDPQRFGVTWDVAAGFMSDPADAEAKAEEVAAIPGVESFAGMSTTAYGSEIGELNTVMLRQEVGRVAPLITEGRAPGRGEVALGDLTMEDNDLRIGDDLELLDEAAGTSTSFEITGVVVLNVAGVDVSIPPGRGALFDWSLNELLDPEQAAFLAPQIWLVDAEPGRTDEVEERLRAIFPTSTSSAAVEPLDLTNLGDASLLPTAFGLVVAVLGVGTVAHAMLSAVRRRRGELAVLKTVGFVRSDTRRVVAWQALTFGTIALVVGIPVGVVGGRVAWSVAAHGLGIPSHAVVDVASVAALAGGFLVLLVLTALVPAQLAGRVPAAVALRRD